MRAKRATIFIQQRIIIIVKFCYNDNKDAHGSAQRLRAQAIGEYAVLLALVVVVITSMSLYVRRALQAQLIVARNRMIDMVRDGVEINIAYEYQPYYLNEMSDSETFIHQVRTLEAGDASGARQIFNDRTAVETTSTTAPAREAR